MLSKAAEVSHQTVKGIVLRVDGPNDFIHGPCELTGGAIDLVQVSGGLGLSVELGADGLAEHGNASETRSEVIVNVPRDPGALPLQGALALDLFQFAANPPAAGPENGTAERGCC